MFRRLRGSIGSKDQAAKLANIALKDDIAAFDLISSMGSADEGVREVASKATIEVARRNYDKLKSLVLRWAGDRHFRMNAFVKWTDGLESRNLERLRTVLIEKIRSGSAVDQLVNQYDSVNQKLNKLKDYFYEKRVTQPVYQTLKFEYESQLLASTKNLLAQFLENAKMVEELSERRAKIKDESSILQTKAVLGDISRKESESMRAELNEQLEETKEKDQKLSEELSVMLISCGPVKVIDETGKSVALAFEFSTDREKHLVELKGRMFTENDAQIERIGENRNELIAFIHNLRQSPKYPPVASDRLTPDIVDEVSGIVASELKTSSEEALHIEKLRRFLEFTPWGSARIKNVSIPTKNLTASEKGFMMKAGTIESERAEPVQVVKPVEVPIVPKPVAQEKPMVMVEKAPVAQESTPPVSPRMPASPDRSAPVTEKSTGIPERSASSSLQRAAPEVKVAEKSADLTDQELQREIKSLQEMLDEDKGFQADDKDGSELVDSKVLGEIGKAAEKLKERMKNR